MEAETPLLLRLGLPTKQHQFSLNLRKLYPEAIPIATTPTQHLSQSFFCRQAELVGCGLVKRKKDGSLLWGVIVETEADSQDDPACHGFRRRSPQKETLFGDSGRFYVYVSYGIHHCVKRAL